MIIYKKPKKPKFKKPTLICGLPGIGSIAKIAADYLAMELGTELLGEIYSNSFPAQVLTEKEECELIKNQFYYVKNLIVLCGNAQPTDCEGMYEVGCEILEAAKELGVLKVISMAAYVSGYDIEKPRVFAAATDPSILDDLGMYGVDKMQEGTISGLNGLIIGLCKLYGMQGICLLGETSGRDISDIKAAGAVIRVLTKMLNVEIDMSGLKEAGRVKEDLIHAQLPQQMKEREDEYMSYYR